MAALGQRRQPTARRSSARRTRRRAESARYAAAQWVHGPGGAALVATPVLYGQPYRDATPDWRAVLLVDDDPIATWSAVLSQMASVLGTELDADTPEGCRMYKEQLSCSIDRAGPAGPGVELRVTARLRTVPTDVTGHYTIQLHARRTVPNPYDSPRPIPGRAVIHRMPPPPGHALPSASNSPRRRYRGNRARR